MKRDENGLWIHTGGRKKGQKNKTTTQAKQFMQNMLDKYNNGEIEITETGVKISLDSDIARMSPKDRAYLMTDIAKHLTPKAKDESEKDLEQAAADLLRKRIYQIDDEMKVK